MTRKQSQDDWLQDIKARQRNIVFPDTANNEAGFWRNIFEGRQRLNAAQMIGIGIFCLAVAGLAFLITFEGNSPLSHDFSWEKLVDSGLRWFIAFAILGGFLLIFTVSQRRPRK